MAGAAVVSRERPAANAALFTVMGLVAALLLVGPHAFADSGPHIGGEAASDGYELAGQQAIEEQSGSASLTAAATPTSQGKSPYRAYQWAPACVTSPDGSALDLGCGMARVCATNGDRLWRLWGQNRRGQWEALGTQCLGEDEPPPPEPVPEVTPGLVLNALRRIGLPALEVQTQPEDKTLVNFATIFYTEPETFTRTLTLLGRSVDVEARASSYTWYHGDGTSVRTSDPGAPYPAKEITHEYTEANQTVRPSVDVTYTARFRVGGGGWREIPETVTISGPESTLRISEATALLSGDYR